MGGSFPAYLRHKQILAPGMDWHGSWFFFLRIFVLNMKPTRTLPFQALLVVGLLSAGLHAQSVGIGTATPDPSARLHIEDNARGLLIPNVTLSATDLATPVSSPATSLLVYNTNTAGSGPTAVSPGFYYWNGSQWVRLLGGGEAWLLTGNYGTDPAVNFLGTTDAQPLVIRTNNTERMRVTASGNVGIGTSSPIGPVEVVREGVSPAFVSTSYSDPDFAGAFVGRRARGTMSAPAAVQSGDALVLIGARGYDGTDFTSASRAFIRMNASENWTPTAQGTQIVLATTANGTTSTAARVVIQGSGDVEVRGGNVLLQNSDNTARQLRLYEPSGAGTNFTAFRAQAQASDIIYTLPASLTTTNTVATGILQTDAIGNLSWLDPSALARATAWALTGNSGTNPAANFLGTTDAQPLCIRVNNQETFRFNPPGSSAPAWSIQRGGGNQRGLHAVDLQSARSAATQVASGDYSVIGGGQNNTASGHYATTGGGYNNTASGFSATVGGGQENTASGLYATIGGGYHNTASGLLTATVGGGQNNTASNQHATVGGGQQNTASGYSATVGGGWLNTASVEYATVGGGRQNTASGQYATVGGGWNNAASGEYSAIPGGSYLRVGARSFGFSGQTSTTQTNLSANSNIAAFVDVDLWLYSRDFTNASQIRFYEAQAHGSGANYVALRAPTSLSANTTYTLPASAPATPAAWLQSDNTGAMSWRPVFYGTVTVDPPNINANTSTTFTVTITGVQPGDLVFLTPPSGIREELVFQGADVTTPNTVMIRMRNVTGADADGAALQWSYMVIRP
jgi:hypothetical protein